MDEIISSICLKLGKTEEDTVRRIKLYDLIWAVLNTHNLKDAAPLCGSSERTLQRILRELFPDSLVNVSWRNKFLNLVELDQCIECKKYIKEENRVSSERVHRCRKCDAIISKKKREENPEVSRQRLRTHYLNNKQYYYAKNANRRAAKIQRTPKWANINNIQEIYKKCPTGFHVDHVIPLQGKLVSGLHVENNLQYLTAEENLRKRNIFTIQN